MRRRPLPPVDDVKRTGRRTALLVASAGTLAATVGCQSATGLAIRTRNRFGRAVETITRKLSSSASVSPTTPADGSATGAAPADDRTAGPTSRDQLAEYGFVPRTYVYDVLREHSGRMKQRQFVDEYGWSASTISRLLSDLEDEEAIDRYRVGREKVVCLPRHGRSPDRDNVPQPRAAGR